MTTNEININDKLANFLTLNLLAHEPCHDFNPTGMGGRLANLSTRIMTLYDLSKDTSYSGGSSENKQTGGACTYDDGDDDTDNCIVDDCEYVDEGSIFNIINGLTFGSITIEDNYKLFLANFGISAEDMSTDKQLNINISDDRNTRSKAVKRRTTITGIQSINEITEYLRMLILSHLQSDVDGEGAVDGEDAEENMREQLQKIVATTTENKEEDNDPDWNKEYEQFGGLQINPNIGNMKYLLPTSNETLSDPKEIVKQQEKPILDSKSKKSTINFNVQYERMNTVLDFLISDYQILHGSENINDIDPVDPEGVKSGLKQAINVIKYYKDVFNYYIKHISNTLPSYTINNSYFVSDALFVYFINYFSTEIEENHIDNFDITRKNEIFEEIFRLRVPVGSEDLFNSARVGESISPEDFKGGAPGLRDTILETIAGVKSFELNEINTFINDNRDNTESGVKTSISTLINDRMTPIYDDITKYSTNDRLGEKKAVWNQIVEVTRSVIDKRLDKSIGTIFGRWKNTTSRNREFTITTNINNILLDGLSKVKKELTKFPNINIDGGDDILSKSLPKPAQEVVNSLLSNVCKYVGGVAKKVYDTNVLAPGTDNIYSKQAELITKVANGIKSPSTLDAPLFNDFVNYCRINHKDNSAIFKRLQDYNDIRLMYNANDIINIVNNAFIIVKNADDKKILDALETSTSVESKIIKKGKKPVKKVSTDIGKREFKIICPITSIIDAQGGFGSCTKGTGASNFIKNNLNISIETDTETGSATKFSYNMSLNHKQNGKTRLEYTLQADDFVLPAVQIDVTIGKGLCQILSANNTFEQALTYLEQITPYNAPINFADMVQNPNHMREIITRLSRKFMGDFGQELNVITKKCGQIGTTNCPTTQHYLLADGDRPSFVRSGLLMLSADNGINKNSGVWYMAKGGGILLKQNGIFGTPSQAGTDSQAGGRKKTKKKKNNKPRIIEKTKRRQTKTRKNKTRKAKKSKKARKSKKSKK